ncbi:toll/interleukin-1 receptor domain-containing protein [Ruminococcaceae bacterium AM07-15]|nr:toll/interleukin-1 receptor domain-containing protein [Ruminococcaceae bacterium AM07-15]
MNKRLFISHASEDKDSFVREFACALRRSGIDVWYDEYEIKPGMSIRESVDKGLALCDVGVLVFSKSYFKKRWTIWELNGLIQKMMNCSATLIPIYYNISHDEILKISPALSDIMGIHFENNLEQTAQKVYETIYPQKPVLVETRSILQSYGLLTPDYYDDWWVNCIEFLGHAHTADIPWSLPRNPELSNVQPKSQALAWACMRYNWIKEAFEMGLNQFTPPEKIIEFINTHPGMYDACVCNIDYLALYAPQLLFQEGEFKEKFKEQYSNSKKSLLSTTFPNDYQCGLTTDHKAPSCNRLYALMDEEFGRYSSISVLRHFIEGEQLGPAPSYVDYWIGLIMLTSHYADIYPEKVRDYLLSGYQNNYSALKLSEIFINKAPEHLATIFNDNELMKQVLNEVLENAKFDIFTEFDDIARKICSLGLTESDFAKRQFRLTIPADEVKYGYRGITFQNVSDRVNI